MTVAKRFDVTGTEFFWENGEIGVNYYWRVDDSAVQSFSTEELDHEGEHAWRAIKAEKTNAQILTDICGLEVESKIFESICRYLQI